MDQNTASKLFARNSLYNVALFINISLVSFINVLFENREKVSIILFANNLFKNKYFNAYLFNDINFALPQI